MESGDPLFAGPVPFDGRAWVAGFQAFDFLFLGEDVLGLGRPQAGQFPEVDEAGLADGPGVVEVTAG